MPGVQSLQRELDRAHDTHAEIFDRLGKLERDNVLQTEQIKTLVDTMNKLIGKLDALVERLDEIQEQPGRRLRDIKDKVIVGVATSLGNRIGHCFARIGSQQLVINRGISRKLKGDTYHEKP